MGADSLCKMDVFFFESFSFKMVCWNKMEQPSSKRDMSTVLGNEDANVSQQQKAMDATEKGTLWHSDSEGEADWKSKCTL